MMVLERDILNGLKRSNFENEILDMERVARKKRWNHKRLKKNLGQKIRLI